jgi:anti-sigma factor RsiW
MNCEEAYPLVQAHVDGELDLPTSVAVEAHLRGCNRCAHEQATLSALRTAFSNNDLYHSAPAQLERRVRAALREARRAENPHRRIPPGYIGWSGAAAAMLLLAIGLKGILQRGPSANEIAARELIDDHLRSLSPNHLTDVLSSNQHTVKPWFDGRLDFAPRVVDLATEGFPLVGGRLDYLNNRQVAAVVYRRRQHIINVFISPAQGVYSALPVGETRAGYNIVGWTSSGMRYWAVSSLNEAELQKFASLLLAPTTSASTPDKQPQR